MFTFSQSLVKNFYKMEINGRTYHLVTSLVTSGSYAGKWEWSLSLELSSGEWSLIDKIDRWGDSDFLADSEPMAYNTACALFQGHLKESRDSDNERITSNYGTITLGPDPNGN